MRFSVDLVIDTDLHHLFVAANSAAEASGMELNAMYM